MTSNRVTAIAFRWMFFTLTVLWLFPPSVLAQNTSATAINGVYEGTYVCAQGPRTLKLSLQAAGNGSLTGIFTFYLPPTSHAQAYSFSLNGTYDAASGRFRLNPVKWETANPGGYSMVGMDGNYDSSAAKVSGNITYATCSSFQASRSQQEPTKNAGSTAPQQAPPAAQVYTQAHSTHRKSPSREATAAPPQTPPNPVTPSIPEPTAVPIQAKLPPPAPANGLVRKSRAYWDTYQSDLIRQIFVGSFGTDIADDKDFQLFFNTYVEMYSKHCRAYLPAQHVTIAVSHNLEKTDRYGNTTSEQTGQTGTLEVDSRFAPSYKEFGQSAASPSSGLAAYLAVASGRATADQVLNPPANQDVDRFFAKESCKSATMHQLNENLLRASTGKLTLQEMKVTIPGAAAESDKSLPPGRYARLVDGCNAFYRDPANSRFESSNDGSYCRCLGVQYQHVMTRDEESIYANDFDRLFRSSIAQPRSVSTDPAWPRLHPAAERCVGR